MKEKNLQCYWNKFKEINEKAMKAYEEKNLPKLISLYGSINYYNGYFMGETLNGFNDEINNLYEYSLVLSRKIYSLILDIL